MVFPIINNRDPMSAVKKEAIKIIESLPENCTLDDIIYELYVKKKVKKGLTAVEKGDLVTHEEVKKRFS